jgi:hypothetical protein
MCTQVELENLRKDIASRFGRRWNILLEDLEEDGKIMLKWNSDICGLDLTSLGYGLMACFCEHGNEHSGFIKGGKLATS